MKLVHAYSVLRLDCIPNISFLQSVEPKTDIKNDGNSSFFSYNKRMEEKDG